MNYPAYTIFILGPSGSGKTTYLVSLFKKLELVGKNNFFLEAEDIGKQKYLVDLYERLAKNGEWPVGTRKISHWIFDCYVQKNDQTKAKACELNLFDYRGGVLTDQAEPEDEEDLSQATQQVAAVLGILDGQKLLAFMRDRKLLKQNVMRWIQKDLSNILQNIQMLDSGTFPVYFIISKWDLLEDANYSLKDIKRQLFEKVPELGYLINQRNQAKRPVYLVPVSSVGQGFASLRNGVMEKNPGTIPLPFGVEVPLALMLTDLHKDGLSANQGRRGFRLKLVVYFLASLVMSVFLKIWGLLLGVYMLLRPLISSKYKNRRNKNNKASAPAVSSVDTFECLLGECRQIRKEFLDQFPEAICTEIKQGVRA